MKVAKSVIRSLSESSSSSSSSSSESELSENEDKSIVAPQNKCSEFELMPDDSTNSHNKNTPTENLISNNDKSNAQGAQSKKRPPSPETMSKILGFEVKEAPRVRISKKKPEESTSNGSAPLSKRICPDILKRADDLEQKYAWCLNDTSYSDTIGTSRSLIPYDIDDMGDDYSSHSTASDNNKDKTTAGKSYKMIGEQWGSMVTPFSDNPSEDSPASRWPEYPSLKIYSNFERENNNKYSNRDNRHKRSSSDRKSKHVSGRKHEKKNVYTQTNSDTNTSASTQTSNKLLPLASKELATSESYQLQVEELKEIYASTTDGVDRVLAHIRISLLETLEAVALAKERTDPSSVSRKFNEVLQRCRQNTDIITKTFKRENIEFLRDAFLVINMKMISFLHHKLYLTRRSEVSGAKNILDEFLMKKTNGEQRMSQRVTSAIQFYATYMEHLAKSLNYSERADTVIDNCKSDFFTDFNFKELKSDSPIQSLVSLINASITELNSMIDELSHSYN